VEVQSNVYLIICVVVLQPTRSKQRRRLPQFLALLDVYGDILWVQAETLQHLRLHNALQAFHLVFGVACHFELDVEAALHQHIVFPRLVPVLIHREAAW
jgi:hypothetical protein